MAETPERVLPPGRRQRREKGKYAPLYVYIVFLCISFFFPSS